MCALSQKPLASLSLARALIFLLLAISSAAQAATTTVEAGTPLQQAIDRASIGDTLLLLGGIHQGPITIDKTLKLTGKDKAIIQGNGEGRVVTISAADVSVSNLGIQNSGDSLATEDAGIYVTKAGERALIHNNVLTGNLIGVYLKGPKNAKVLGNTIIGSENPHVNDRGNGVQLWNTPGSIVADNNISLGRDGIFVNASENNIFRDNVMHNLRFAVHYMYTHNSTVSGNLSRGNHVAYALMYSNNLEVHDNVSDGDRDRGLFLNFTNDSNFSNNRVSGAEKCFFIYNANSNDISNNSFSSCDIGIHFTAGSEGNAVSGNAFIDNKTQVKYVGTRYVEWSSEGRGNFWSDNLAFDLNDDGIADQPYKPNDMVDQLIWRHPMAKLLLSSPAMQVLRWAQSEFPSLHPGGVRDSSPLMTHHDRQNNGSTAQ
ncbi:MAG: nitrous oxide reductase family maturation protein NosD [Proteobacteria bacterium]|nr:nitrous oxide reductase family maturation protein NosD [Pseudomonadota bacterium]